MGVLELRNGSLYCTGGDFFIDPWEPAGRALITHAHSDHARPGATSYLTAEPGGALLRARLGDEAAIETVPYGEQRTIGDVSVSFHPAGHILGSAQIRIEERGEVWVVSGDYKLTPDPTCAPFEPLHCHTFVTESTFGLPIFRWPTAEETAAAIHAWWRGNREAGKISILFAYALGKAQRVHAMLDSAEGPIYRHEAVERYSRFYGNLPPVATGDVTRGALILAPPGCHGTAWEKSFGAVSTAMASGWMRIRGTRRRRSLDRGFVLSDHADWPELLRAIDETRAETVWVTHGFRAPLARWLTEHGRQAIEAETRFEEAEA